jgi:predicted HAD superfamily Cof-like phosphohydrolase
MTTAYRKALELPGLTNEMREALAYDVHPQERTRLFHEVFGAPIHSEQPAKTMSHMTDQRIAFRVAFILSEALELLEKGLGLQVSLEVTAGREHAVYRAESSDNAELTTAVVEAMFDRGETGRDVVEVVDALGDLNVVVNGFALELGVDMREIDGEILASNLTKLGADGQPIVADGSDPKFPAGKILKGPGFTEPRVAEILGLD